MIFKATHLCLILALLQVVCGNPKSNQKIYLEQENSCRDVCSLCDCEGFYCEDECICECDIEEEENLQCISDMKKECDKNGLEYEILLQDSAKERFLRQVSGNPFTDFSKNFVIMKQKREPSPTPEPQTNSADPIVGAANPNSGQSKPTATRNADPESANADPLVGAANPNPEDGDESSPKLGMALAGKTAATATKAAIAAKTAPLAFKAFTFPIAAKTAIATGAAKTAIASKAIATGAAVKTAAATTAVKSAVATGALAGLGTKLKANKLLFTLGAPKQEEPAAPAAPSVPDWMANWKFSPVLGAPKPRSDPAPTTSTPSPAPAPPASSSRPRPFTFGPVQPAHLMDDE